MLKVGDRVPDVEAVRADGKPFRLKDYRGKRSVVLYFFPKDFTPGCTKEACTFRDRNAEVGELDAEVIGVSTDTADKHAEFAKHYNLPFTLVSDRDASLAAAFGVSRLGGWLPSKRVTFVIDKDGVVRNVIQSEFNIDKHVQEAIDSLKIV